MCIIQTFYHLFALKAFCDVTTDGGGFILVAKKDDPVTWTVPSSNETVDPHGKPHWSSIFGKVKMLDIRFQISTTSKFENTKAHWSFRLTSKRPFGELLVRNFGGCTRDNPGIGDIAFVKDLQTGKVVNKNFRCSVFSGHVSSLIGWGKMNKCLQQPCSLGFAYFPGLKNLRLEDSGSYSYSAHGNSTNSGILHSSSAFVGCSHKKCCACYGPKGGNKNYCLTNCTSINGGIVKKKVHVWIWIRSSIPTRAWRKCVEYIVTDKNGKKETYSVDEETGIRREGSCAYSDEIKKNGAVLVVPNEDAVKKIPSAPGLLLYRPDKEILSVRGAKDWKKIAMHNEVKYQQQLLNQQENRTEEKLEKQKESLEKKIIIAQIELEKKLKNEQLQQEKLEKQLNGSIIQRKALEKELEKLEKRFNNTFEVLFMDSKILRGKSIYIIQLSQWVLSASSWLCYRATRDGWSSHTFHSKCDNKGATVTIIRVGSYIFGGYSDASWGGKTAFTK
ncbi:Hypothetical predicted protein [Paramuricea clavata]|uniref:Uncharacterized protein n=1 Tax=Paramuricea clavata TaxID=317549 RepID=A0A7D9L966_PARCT|nr:Hypothetical predicted protein [Paramuricea clavata]